MSAWAWAWVLGLAVLAALVTVVVGTWWLLRKVMALLDELGRLGGRVEEAVRLVDGLGSAPPSSPSTRGSLNGDHRPTPASPPGEPRGRQL